MTILMQKLHARNRVEVLIAAQKLDLEHFQASHFTQTTYTSVSGNLSSHRFLA